MAQKNTRFGPQNIETAIANTDYVYALKGGNTGLVSLTVLLTQIKAALNLGGVARSIRTVVADDEMTNADHTILADGTSATVEVKLPADPAQGQIHNVFCVDKTQAVTVVGNGNNVNGGATTITFAAALNSIMFQFDTTYGWAAIGRFIAA